MSQLIIQVLAEADSELRVKEIQVAVEELLASTVSRHSIKGYLHRGCQQGTPLFKRLARGRYRLVG